MGILELEEFSKDFAQDGEMLREDEDLLVAVEEFEKMFIPQTVWTHLGVLTVRKKQLCLDRCAALACAANSLLFTVHSCLLKSSKCNRLPRLAESVCLRRVLPTTALSLWCRAHFCIWWSFFVAGSRETSCFGASSSTFRDRCKGSELFYFELQFSWQVQHFGHGGDCRGAQISRQAQ